jgi:hypothetical protein
LGSSINVLFHGDLVAPSEFSKEILEEFLATGYAVEQLIDGQRFIRMTELYYKELGDYITKHPKELCIDYWKRIVKDTTNCDIMGFVKRLCEAHITIKKLTNNEVDFIETIKDEI